MNQVTQDTILLDLDTRLLDVEENFRELRNNHNGLIVDNARLIQTLIDRITRLEKTLDALIQGTLKTAESAARTAILRLEE